MVWWVSSDNNRSSFRVPEPAKINGGEETLLSNASIEHQLHVARAFELLEDHLITPSTRVDQTRGQHGEGSRCLDVSGRPEDSFGPVEGHGVDTTRHGSSASGVPAIVVERSAQSGERIHQEQNVFPSFKQSPRARVGKEREIGVGFQIHVVGTGQDFAGHVPVNSVTSSGRSSIKTAMMRTWG